MGNHAYPITLRAVPSHVGEYTHGSVISLNLEADMRDSAELIRESRRQRMAQLDRASADNEVNK